MSGPLYDIPSASSDAVALSSTVATVIGGVNQSRRSITVTSNDMTQKIWLYWGSSATTPSAATVKAKGQPLYLAGSSATFPYSLYQTGTGTDPTLYGLADSSDQVLGTNDTRWSEGA